MQLSSIGSKFYPHDQDRVKHSNGTYVNLLHSCTSGHGTRRIFWHDFCRSQSQVSLEEESFASPLEIPLFGQIEHF